jgi:hypothetical protein
MSLLSQSPDAPPPITPTTHFAPSPHLDSLRCLRLPLGLRLPFPILLNAFTSHPAAAETKTLPLHSFVGHWPLHLGNPVRIRVRRRVLAFASSPSSRLKLPPSAIMWTMSRDSSSAITRTSTLSGSVPESESNTHPQARPVPLQKSRRATYRDISPYVGMSGSVPAPPHRVETDQDEAPGQRQSHGQAQGAGPGCQPESGLDAGQRRGSQSAGVGTGAGEGKQSEEGFVHGYRDVPSLAAIRERVRERGMSVSTVPAVASPSNSVPTSVPDSAATAEPGALGGGGTYEDKLPRTDTPQSPSRGGGDTSIGVDGAAKCNTGKDGQNGKLDPSTSPPSTASTASTTSSGSTTTATASASPPCSVVPDRKKPEHPLRHAWYVQSSSQSHCPVPVVTRTRPDPPSGRSTSTRRRTSLIRRSCGRRASRLWGSMNDPSSSLGDLIRCVDPRSSFPPFLRFAVPPSKRHLQSAIAPSVPEYRVGDTTTG